MTTSVITEPIRYEIIGLTIGAITEPTKAFIRTEINTLIINLTISL